MAVYGFLNEALETKDSEPKGKLKKLIDRVKSMMNKEKQKSEKIEDQLKNPSAMPKKKSVDESFLLEADNAKEITYYTIDVKPFEEKLKLISSNINNFFEYHAIENDIKQYLKDPAKLRQEDVDRMEEKLEQVRKKNEPVLKELSYNSRVKDPYYEKAHKKDSKNKDQPEPKHDIKKVTFDSSSGKDPIQAINDANEFMESFMKEKIDPVLKKFDDCDGKYYWTFLKTIETSLVDWSRAKHYEGKEYPVDYDAWNNLLSCLEGKEANTISGRSIDVILYNYKSFIWDAINSNKEIIKRLELSSSSIENELGKEDIESFAKFLNLNNIDFSKFSSEIKSLAKSNKIKINKYYNIENILKDFKKYDEWEDNYDTYNKFLKDNKSILDKIKNSNPIVLTYYDEGHEFERYIIYCIKDSSLYQLVHCNEDFYYSLKKITFDQLKSCTDNLDVF